MTIFTRFVAVVLVVLFTCSLHAAPPVTQPSNCAVDEYSSNEHGVTTCKKVPACKGDGEIISYDQANQKFVCKKLIQCGCPNTNVPCSERKRREQAVYINGKNECLYVPDCEKTHQNYVFEGGKYYCR
jgi:hypothetical protein